jgi:AGZA family xanthine/uracil permease-like MFS transporter
VIAICFALALFLSPLFLAIPAAATDPALVVVGVMMCSSISKIDWNDYSEAIPAFLTMLLMPLCYSISEGIMIGVIVFVVLNGLSGHGRAKKISITMWVLAALFLIRYLVNGLRAAGLF